MNWYTKYKLIPDGEGYILEIHLNNESAEFAKEFLSEEGRQALNLEDKIKELVGSKLSDFKINTVKLMVGAIMVATIPFAAIAAATPAAAAQPAAVAAAAQPASTVSGTYQVTASKLNVRSGPSTSYTVIHALWQGNKVTVIGESGNWYQIRLSDGRTGWVSKDYLIPFSEKTGTVTATSLNVRSGPSTSNSIITAISNGTRVTILSESNGWYNVRLPDGRTGWASGQYISTAAGTGTVTATSLNVRTGPSTSNTIITTIPNGTRVTILGDSGNWYNVRLPDGRIGWVSKDYIKPDGAQTNTKQQKIDAVIAAAKAQLGMPYVFGGASPKDGGFDCSGLTQYSFGQAGYIIDRVSSAQATNGISVPKSEIKPGDLVFFSINQNGIVDHVGIYLGNGQMIHSPKPGDTVKTVSINTSYWQQRYVTARRIIY